MAESLDAYRRTLTTLREQLAEVDARRAKILAAISVIEDLLGSPSVRETVRLPTKPERVFAVPPSNGKPATMPEAVGLILAEAGRPLHLTEIISRMIARYYPDRDPKKIRATLTGTLDRRVAAKDVFTKTKPATYGLLDWEGAG